MCLNETFLNDKITNINLIHNFTILRNDRKEKRGGGVAFIINKRINYSLLKSKSTNDYEYLAIELISSNEKITLLNIYTHPQSKTNYNFIEKILKLTANKLICVGDMNATNMAWYCNSTNKRGKFLEAICDKNNLNIMNQSKPTSRKSTNVIDLVLCSEELFHRLSDIVVDLTFDLSDHWPVRFKLIFSPGKSMIKNINWELFKSDLEAQFKDKMDVILSKEEFENKACTFSKTITECLANNTREVEKTSHKINIPTYLLNLIKAKKKLKRLFTKTHDPEISNLINNISNKIKRHNKRLMQEKWNDHCAFLAKSKPSEQVYWRIIKQVEAGNIPNSTNILPNTPIAKDKAMILAEFYESVFKNDFFDRNFENIFDLGEQYNEITLGETITAIASSKSTNSTGMDNISLKVLKNLPIGVIKYLTTLFNYSLRFHHVPKCWKIAKIKVLKKKDIDLDNPSSYRPISLLVTTSRILEKIMNQRITNWADSINLIHPCQSGFRSNHSCQDNIFKMIETCKIGLQNGQKSGKVDFDVEKAFDKAPHKGILMTLKSYECPSYIGRWLVSFFSDRSFVVEIEGSISEEKDILAGVPQGSPLSPLLFSLFINGIGKILERHDIHFALFADDLTIWKIDKDIYKIQDILQKTIDDINSFFGSKGLKLNESKCVYTLFTKKSDERLDLKINDYPIEYFTNPKSLGIYFDPKLKFNFHFQEIKNKIITKINLLRILSNKSNRINVNHLLTIYKSLILSKLQYSMMPFLVSTNKVKKELQSLQNKCLKIILNVPIQTSSKVIHQTLKCEKLDKRLAQLTCNFLAKAKINNSTIKPVFDLHNENQAVVTKSKRSILQRINTLTLIPQLSTTQYF